MYILTEAEFCREAEPYLRQVFVNDNQFDQPFAANVVGRRIVYPCHGAIESPLIDAIIAAAAHLGDTGCYISLRGISGSEAGPNHCYVPLSEFHGIYIDPQEELIGPMSGMNPYGLETAIYSASGKWGILTSYEWHGLLGGPSEFIAEIRAAIPDLDEQVYGFLERLRWLLVDAGINPPDVTRNKWLPGLLAHVYGQEAAEEILQQEVRRRSSTAL